jgi:hypothetical protein
VVKGRVAVDAQKDVLKAIKKHLDPALELVPVPEGLKEAIETLSTAQYFIGESGDSMHLAAAMNLRSIIVVPEPVYLPQFVDIGDGTEWLYPQSVHLTLRGKTPLTPELSATSLAAAMAGDVYPFWTDAYLRLVINEPCSRLARGWNRAGNRQAGRYIFRIDHPFILIPPS